MFGKKGFLRTLEAFIAAVLGLIVLFVILSKTIPGDQEIPSSNILEKLSNDDNFRTCALENNFSCVNDTVANFLPAIYTETFSVHLTNDASFIPDDLPDDRRVYAESLFISGNLTEITPVIVRLYYFS